MSADTSVFQLLQDNPSQLISRGEQYCPRVAVVPRELYVPNNVPQELSLTVTNLPPDLMAAEGGAPLRPSSSARQETDFNKYLEGLTKVLRPFLRCGAATLFAASAPCY